ncbi:MAG: hypothetical protein AAF363_21975 [Bacteroidota bacterium]
MKFKLLLLSLFLGLCFYSCKTSSEKKSTGLSRQDSLKIYFTGLHDSIDGYWKEMIADDDDKLFNIKRLLEEVSYTSSFSQKAYDSLLKAHEQLVGLRYDQQSMSNSQLIDRYDATSAELIYEVINFAESNPDYEKYPLMKQLIVEIREADHRVLFHRIKYDNYAFQYNAFLDTYPDLTEKFSKNSDAEKYPVFTLEE